MQPVSRSCYKSTTLIFWTLYHVGGRKSSIEQGLPSSRPPNLAKQKRIKQGAKLHHKTETDFGARKKQIRDKSEYAKVFIELDRCFISAFGFGI